MRRDLRVRPTIVAIVAAPVLAIAMLLGFLAPAAKAAPGREATVETDYAIILVDVSKSMGEVAKPPASDKKIDIAISVLNQELEYHHRMGRTVVVVPNDAKVLGEWHYPPKGGVSTGLKKGQTQAARRQALPSGRVDAAGTMQKFLRDYPSQSSDGTRVWDTVSQLLDPKANASGAEVNSISVLSGTDGVARIQRTPIIILTDRDDSKSKFKRFQDLQQELGIEWVAQIRFPGIFHYSITPVAEPSVRLIVGAIEGESPEPYPVSFSSGAGVVSLSVPVQGMLDESSRDPVEVSREVTARAIPRGHTLPISVAASMSNSLTHRAESARITLVVTPQSPQQFNQVTKADYDLTLELKVRRGDGRVIETIKAEVPGGLRVSGALPTPPPEPGSARLSVSANELTCVLGDSVSLTATAEALNAAAAVESTKLRIAAPEGWKVTNADGQDIVQIRELGLSAQRRKADTRYSLSPKAAGSASLTLELVQGSVVLARQVVTLESRARPEPGKGRLSVSVNQLKCAVGDSVSLTAVAEALNAAAAVESTKLRIAAPEGWRVSNSDGQDIVLMHELGLSAQGQKVEATYSLSPKVAGSGSLTLELVQGSVVLARQAVKLESYPAFKLELKAIDKPSELFPGHEVKAASVSVSGAKSGTNLKLAVAPVGLRPTGLRILAVFEGNNSETLPLTGNGALTKAVLLRAEPTLTTEALPKSGTELKVQITVEVEGAERPVASDLKKSVEVVGKLGGWELMLQKDKPNSKPIPNDSDKPFTTKVDWPARLPQTPPHGVENAEVRLVIEPAQPALPEAVAALPITITPHEKNTEAETFRTSLELQRSVESPGEPVTMLGDIQNHRPFVCSSAKDGVAPGLSWEFKSEFVIKAPRLQGTIRLEADNRPKNQHQVVFLIVLVAVAVGAAVSMALWLIRWTRKNRKPAGQSAPPRTS